MREFDEKTRQCKKWCVQHESKLLLNLCVVI